ncbi:MAG: GntR family transcriptional regulator [Oscillospiraceae bacterium]|nr:GntR family transcriptional regulator [Oscillospiraceae bacterium]
MNYNSQLDQTKAERVTSMLRADIINKEFAPGSHITIKEISDRYHASNIPVREALRTLESEHILEINPYKGATVLEVDEKYAALIYDVLRGLELITYESIFTILTDEFITELRAVNQEIGKLQDTEDDRKRYLRLNDKLHTKLIEASPNTIAKDLYYKYIIILQSFREIYLPEYDRVRQAYKEHENIIHAIEQKDSMELKRCVDIHSNAAGKNLHDLYLNRSQI